MNSKSLIPLVSGILFTTLGMVFLAPIFYRDHLFDENVVGPFIGITLGVSFLLIGMASLSHINRVRAKDKKACESIQDPIEPTVKQAPVKGSMVSLRPHIEKHPADSMLVVLGRVFVWIGHSVALLSVAGTVLMFLFGSAGSASGVPIFIGVFVSTLFYGFGGICRLLCR